MRLLLFRHAKSDWSRQLEDHERPLSRRGREAAPAMGAWMARHAYIPKVVLCSAALRARETLECLLHYFHPTPKISYEEALYLGEWPQLLKAVQNTCADASPLLLVGHNPGLELLAIALALKSEGAADQARAEALAEKFPTAALAVLDFDQESWATIRPDTGRLVAFVRPKDLRGREAEKP